MAISAGSYSRLQVFEQCKFRAYLQFDQRIPEPPRALRPGTTEHANDRGSRIHDAGEAFSRGLAPLIQELHKFTPEFTALQRLFKAGKATFEGEWAMDRDWNIIDWKSKEVLLRLKIDALVHLSKYEAVVIDYKSGKRFGNEIKHAEQTQLYALTTFLRHPELEEITTELWYTDINDLVPQTFTREQGLRFKRGFNTRLIALTTAEHFPPNPNIHSCKYCPYTTGPGGTGHCVRGVPNSVYA